MLRIPEVFFHHRKEPPTLPMITEFTVLHSDLPPVYVLSLFRGHACVGVDTIPFGPRYTVDI
jgi:hypothetical protein